MADPLARLRRFLRELKRRNVYKVAVTYGVVGFVLIQAADLIFPALNIPSWAYSLVVVLVLIGFPIALIVAWAFEMSPEGMRRTGTLEGEDSVGSAYQWIGLALVVALAGGVWYATAGDRGEKSSETARSATDTARTKGAANPDSAAPRLGNRSIAVLPFEALGQKQPGAFTEGMHDALLTRLSNVSGLKVVSRTAVQQYRGSDKTTGEIAQELGVRWVLEGGVQEMGDRIQVNAQLIDPRTETHAWAEQYRRDLTAQDLFDLQGEITRRIARSLEAQLTAEETERVERRPTEDLDAYRLYVQGRGLLDQRQPETVANAVDYFQRALRQDSTYALAWSGLADALTLQRFFDIEVSPDVPMAREAARRALQLDPNLAEGHASLGVALATERRGPAALRELQRAVELKPSYAQAQHWLGVILLILGNEESALEPLRRAVELNPQHGVARAWLATAYLANGRVDRGLQTARGPGGSAANLDAEVRALLRQERIDAARQLADRQDTCCEESLFILAMIDVAAGDPTTAKKRLNEMQQGDTGSFAVGLVQAALGEIDAAYETLLGAPSEASSPLVLHLRYGFPDLLASFRKDPRYKELIGEINHQWGLHPDGSLPDSMDVSFETPASE